MDERIGMDREQIGRLIDNYVRWIEIGTDQMKHIQVGIDMATNNIRDLFKRLQGDLNSDIKKDSKCP